MFFHNKKILLASSSQSRKKLFKKVGLNFKTISPKVNEEKYRKKFNQKKFSIKKIAGELAKIKSIKISKKHKNILVVGCDTTISLKNHQINKAKNTKEAKKILQKLSGKKHYIYTGVCLSINSKEIVTYIEKTVVYIRKMNNKEIDFYLKKVGNKILKSAGCYQAENAGPAIFSKIDGDFYNVLGFPILWFLKYLRKKIIYK